MAALTIKRKPPALHHRTNRGNPLYGYDYNPHMPSILSIAHDVSDGGRLFIITDRPCGLANAGLPLTIPGLAVLDAVEVLPIKFSVGMNGLVPAGALWHWAGNNSAIYDLATGSGTNAGSGTVADIVGPYTPPPLLNVVTASVYPSGCLLTFDQPIVLNPPTPLPPPTPDDAMTFDGQTANFITQTDAYTLFFNLAVAVGPGSVWAITRQPSWVASLLTVPAGGTF